MTTGFRDRNLHFLHVDRVKGRTYRARHAAHASTQPHQIRETDPVGDWQRRIGYTNLANGGTCAPGCSRSKSEAPRGSNEERAREESSD